MLIMSRYTINIDPNFDPDTWCKEDLDLAENPVKKIICFLVELITFIPPLTSFVEIIFNTLRDLIIDARDYTEIFIILTPIIPLGILMGYFFDTM